MKTKFIEIKVADYFGVRQNIIVPNISWGLNIHECDLMVVRNSGYALEVEIKVSLADLKKDATKGHGHESDKIKELYFAIPDVHVEKWTEFIPERAGILGVKDGGRVVCHRSPEANKTARKLTPEEIAKVAKLGVMRYWRMRNKEPQNKWK